MKMRTWAAAGLISILGWPGSISAQSIWDGGAGTALWSDANNWNPNGLPGASASVQFTGAGLFGIDLNGNRTIGSLSFAGASGYTLSNNTLTVSSGAITVAAPASGSVTHTIASGLSFSADATATVGASATLLFSGAVNGSGTLTKAGTGTLVLSGANTFTGNTTISAGTLQLGNSTTTGTLSGNIVNNASLVFKYSALTDFTGDISGTGSVTQNGASNLRLAGTNTFSGGLSVVSGNVAVGNGGATGSITSDVANNGNLIFNRTTDYTYAGAITGNGTVFKVNSNVLTLTGTNTYAGSTNMEGGTLVFSQLSNLGSGGTLRFGGGALRWASGNTTDISTRTVTVDSGGATLDTNGNNVTIAGAIGNAGTGALAKTGSGTLTLGGTNTYTGGTTVSAGTLKFSSLNNFGTGGIAVDGGTLQWGSGNTTDITSRTVTVGAGGGTFDVASNTTLAGVIGGAGALTRTGSNTLTLGGANTYSGGTVLKSGVVAFSTPGNLGTGGLTFDGGTLRWATGSTADISARAITIGSGGAFLDTNGNDVTLAGSFSSANALTKSGNGTLNLTGTATVGNLSASGPVKVSAGGILTTTLTSSIVTTFTSTFTVDGAGSTWNTGSNLYVGSGGTLNVTGGGSVVSTGTAAVSKTSGTATANITGSGSSWTVAQLQLGFAGSSNTTGNLNVTSGGSLVSTIVQLGLGSKGTGTATIDGASSTWTNSNYIELGNNSGTGALVVQNGGTVTTKELNGTGTVTLNNGTLALTGTDTVFAPIAVGSGGGTLSVASGQTVTMDAVISGAGAFTKSGAGRLRSTVTNTLTGGISIDGGTLAIDSSTTLAASSGVTVETGGTFAYNSSTAYGGALTNDGGAVAGTGNLTSHVMSGFGSVSPGDGGAGILTAASTDPSDGLAYNFQFDSANTLPDWSSSSASRNDVLRLTAATPFRASLASYNVVSVYLGVSSVDPGAVFTGGFYTDNAASFLAQVSGASFQYYLATTGGSVTFDGAAYEPYTGPGFSIGVVAQSANFSLGSANGYVTQFTAVPEPGTWALLAGALGLLASGRRLRRGTVSGG